MVHQKQIFLGFLHIFSPRIQQKYETLHREIAVVHPEVAGSLTDTRYYWVIFLTTSLRSWNNMECIMMIRQGKNPKA